MALATRCPHCHSVFRVVADQLKLRGGLVRCGQCHTVFDAIGALTYLDDAQLRQAAPAQTPPPPAPEVSRQPDILLEAEPAVAASHTLPAPPLPERAAQALRELADALASAPAPAHEPLLAPATSGSGAQNDPARAEHGELQASDSPAPARSPDSTDTDAAREIDACAERLTAAATGESGEPQPSGTARDFETPDPQAADAGPDPVRAAPSAPAPLEDIAEPAIEAEATPPEIQPDATLAAPAVPALLAAQDAVGSTLAEPEFLRRAAQEERRRRRSRWWAAGCAVLTLVLVGELLLAFRAQLLTRWPQAYPLLVEACAPLGCEVSWPAAPGQLAVLASDLQALPGTSAFELNVSLRNRAPFPQALPALELTLTDTRGQPLIRKVVLPGEYLPAQRADHLAAGEDLAARIFFEVQGQAPAGFLVYPFHP